MVFLARASGNVLVLSVADSLLTYSTPEYGRHAGVTSRQVESGSEGGAFVASVSLRTTASYARSSGVITPARPPPPKMELRPAESRARQ